MIPQARKQIEIGLSDGDRIEVVAGLDEGAVVLVPVLKMPEGASARSASPLFSFSSRHTPSASRPSAFISANTAPASMSPERVPMTRPSSGVMPMLVSVECPNSTAQALAPFPRWSVTSRSSASGRPS